PVIICAIAEAEMIGRNDLASDIIRVFIAPVVYQHQLANAHPQAFGLAPMPAYERGSCALPRSPREEASRGQATSAQAMPTAAAPAMPDSAAQAAPPRAVRPATDEEIRAMLNANPQAFMQMMATRGVPVIEVPIEAVHDAAQQQSMPSMPPI